jgi:pilus assembly protein CpaF
MSVALSEWPDQLLSALEPVMDLVTDPNITDISVTGYKTVRVKRPGGRGYELVEGVGWAEKEDCQIACIRIGEVIGRRLSAQQPMLDARLPDGSRVNIVIPPVCAAIAISIRKFPEHAMTAGELLRLGSVGPDLWRICQTLIAAECAILVAGRCGSGKTSLLNALSGEIPSWKHVVTMEEARELRIQQEHWTAWETVEWRDRSISDVTIRELVRGSLRQDPDWAIVGEVRDLEAFFLLRMLRTGHAGMGTIHADSAIDALEEVTLLQQMAGIGDMNTAIASRLTARSLDAVIYQDICSDGRRRLTEIVLLDEPGIVVKPTGEVSFRTLEAAVWDGEAGRWRFPQGPPPKLAKRLRQSGAQWPVVTEEDGADVAA